MRETTFAANIRYRLLEHDPLLMPGEPEFYRIGAQVFESEDLIDRLITAYLSLMTNNGWAGGSKEASGTIANIGNAYMNGFYFPCVERIVLSGQIDVSNDGIPEYAGLVDFGQDGTTSFVSVLAEKPPIGVAAPPFSKPLACTFLNQGEDSGRGVKADIRFDTAYVAVTAAGQIVPCNDRRRPPFVGDLSSVFGVFCQSAALAINAWTDSKHIWNVETGESVIGKQIKTPMKLGIGKEHVKSLFYARSLPVTETGRKRPILHWVRAHARRIKEGVDIDVAKHLRGVDAFEMDGFHFKITNPIKTPASSKN